MQTSTRSPSACTKGKHNEQSRRVGTMQSLERALKHLDKLPENGWPDAIDKRLEKCELSETEDAVLNQHFAPARGGGRDDKNVQSDWRENDAREGS
jgi:hypothetical protein